MYINIHQPLIDKCLENDREAQSRIYRLYFKSMYNTSLRIVNRSLDYLRKRRVEFEEAHSDLPVYEEEQEDETQFTVDEVKDAISQLSDGYRTILSLLLLEGYNHEEVSGILGISNVTSRTQFSRAKQHLRDLLTENRKKQRTIPYYG